MPPRESFLRSAAPERGLATKHLVQDTSESIDIGSLIYRNFAGRLFRAHVGGSAGPQSLGGPPLSRGRIHGPSNAEIRYQCMAAAEQDVLGLYVSVDEPAMVRVSQRVGHFPSDLQCVEKRQPLLTFQAAPE
jgi:hypothetical protein